ncbi:hypothetical protein KQH90_12465 [Anaerosalibacter bizertensis]|uniref:hypothetical protein n=1 Tax=Anaerosalibacter bizertensis TaxID=932217 RepID=UPI001C0EF5BA|nr:hypothetical protein [Anaerosalibacter bizertensis]MBU5294816.1 hypothetical protein [Anaerosalibacter bizertensis]
MDKIVIKESEKNRRLKIVGLFMGIILVIVGIKTKKTRELFIGLIFLYFTVYKKENTVTKDGVIYRHKGIFVDRKDSVDFSTLDRIIVYRARDGKYIFYFDREEDPKGIKVEREYAESIVKLIESREDKVPIEYACEPFEEDDDEE